MEGMQQAAERRVGQIAAHLVPCAKFETELGAACSAAEEQGKVISARDAAALVPDGATLTVTA